MDKAKFDAGVAKFVAFFDKFCKELDDRAEFPKKLFGSFGSKCKGNAELVGLCLIPAFPLIDAIKLRNQMTSPVDHSVLMTKLQESSRGAIGLEYLYTPLKGGTTECKFLHAASRGISAFLNNAEDETPIRLVDLMKNIPKSGPLGISEHLQLAANLLASKWCITQEDKAAAAAVVAEVAADIYRFPSPPTTKPTGQGGGSRKTRRLSRGRHVRRRMSTRHRAKSHKRTMRKSRRSHR